MPMLLGQVPGDRSQLGLLFFCKNCYVWRDVHTYPGRPVPPRILGSISRSIFPAAAARSEARPVTGVEKVRVGMGLKPGTCKAHSLSHELDTAWLRGASCVASPRTWSATGCAAGPSVVHQATRQPLLPATGKLAHGCPSSPTFCSHK